MTLNTPTVAGAILLNGSGAETVSGDTLTTAKLVVGGLILALLAFSVGVWLYGDRLRGVWIGMSVFVMGLLADGYWHLVTGVGDVGQIPPAHLVSFVGVLAVLASATNLYRRSERPVSLFAAGLSAVALLLVVAMAWDNALHYQGVEPEGGPHTLKGIGLFGSVLLSVALTGVENGGSSIKSVVSNVTN